MPVLNTMRFWLSTRNEFIAKYNVNYAGAMEIKDKIKALRKLRGWSQPELSERCGWGYSQARISNYETGHRQPGVDDLRTLAKALGVTLEMLLDEGLPASLPPVESTQALAIRAALDELDEEAVDLLVRFARYLGKRK